MPLRSVRTSLRLPASALALALAACDAPAGGANAAPAPPPPSAETPRAAPGGASFVVRYGAVRDSVYAQWQDDFRQAGFLEGMAEWLNGWIALPRPVTF